MKTRKNPYGIVWLPVLALAAAGSTGFLIGASLGTYIRVNEEINRIQNYDGVSKTLKAAIATIREGGETGDILRPTLMTRAPTNERQALLQAGWGVMQVAAKLTGADRIRLCDAAENFWDKSEDASKAILEPNDPKIQEPLLGAIEILKPYGDKASRAITMLYAQTSQVSIADSISFEKETFDPSKYVKEALTETGKQVSLPFQVAAGLLTGERPYGMPQWKWNLIRFSIYGGVGLAGIGYLMTVGRPYVELLQSAREDKR